MTARFTLALLLPLAALAACSSATPLSTASLGGGSGEATQPTEPVVRNDPASRALQVGTVSARAVKCGYNFDPAKLKASYLAWEASSGASTADLAKIEQIYTVGFNGVAKAVAGEENYCTEAKTREIKADLTRHLAGDYTPPPTKVVAKKEEGFFSDFFSNDDPPESGPKFGSDAWWEKQREKSGR